MAKNTIIAGDYKGNVCISLSNGKIGMATGLFKSMEFNKETVKSYEVVTEETAKSVSSGIARGIVGGILLGPAGMIGGALLAKNKGMHQVAIEFSDGKKSLVELDDKLFKIFTTSMF